MAAPGMERTTMKWISEGLKIDPANLYLYQILATPAPGIRSRYYRLRDYGKIVFAFVVDTMAAAATVVASVIEATSNAGAGAAAIATATCTITANTNANVATAVLTTVLVGDTITINGVVFTAAAAPDFPNLVFDQSGADAADAASLAACINAAAGQAALLAAGCAVTAAVLAGSTVTLTVTEAGAGSLTVTSVGGTMVIATVQAIGYIEIEDTALTNGFDYVALQLVGAATSHATMIAMRGEPRYEAVVQAVAASDTDA